jgi:hypothetical protein
MAATAHARVPRLENFVGRSKRARANRAWVAEGADVDEDTVLRWAKGQEPIPDDVIDWLAHSLGFSVRWIMRWEDAPRSEIPEIGGARRLRRTARNVASNSCRTSARIC